MKQRKLKAAGKWPIHPPAGASHKPILLSCSILALASSGVLCLGANEALAAAPGVILPRGTVPTKSDYRINDANVGIRDITTAATATGNRTTIWQNQRAAIGNFDRFDIAAGSEVHVDQADAGYRLLARIFDANPTTIQGLLTAPGQVYLLNRNGILFDHGAQVNVQTLIASTLNLPDNAFLDGFDASAANSASNKYTKFVPFTDAQGNALASAPILVGAHGASPQSANASLNALPGGAIVLIAPQIENRGVITATDGQVILAAGQKAYLWQRNTESIADPKASAVRGLMVEITAQDGDVNVTSMVRNLGEINADRGNVSIAALAINQEGRISAGSSAVLNGSVWLTARSIVEPAAPALSDSDVSRSTNALGTVSFGKGSYTGTPLLVDEGRLSESASYSAFQASTVDADNNSVTYSRDFRSWIHIVGNKIDNQGTIASPGGTIDLLALGAASRVLLEPGSVISAAGNWVARSMADNMLTIPRLTSNDLQDSPLLKTNALLGKAVTVDVRQGSPLFDVSKYTDNLQRTVQDKATAGGDINIEARSGEIIATAGSAVDVSGGGFRYAGGSYKTSKLLGADGKLYDIGSASRSRQYVAVDPALSQTFFKAGPAGWNVTLDYASRLDAAPIYESAYLEGAGAGSLKIVAPTVVADGDWRGGVTLGRYQVVEEDPTRLPQVGTLTLGDPSGRSSGGADFVVNRIIFGRRASLPADLTLDTPLPASAQPGEIVLGSDQFRIAEPQAETFQYLGFGTLQLYANQSIIVPAGSNVQLAPGGTFNAATNDAVASSTIRLEGASGGLDGGTITVPAGHVSLASKHIDIGGAQYAPDGSLAADGARIDVSGVVLADARPDSDLLTAGGFSAHAGASLSDYVKANFAVLLDSMAEASRSGQPVQAVPMPRHAIDAADASISVSGADVSLGAGATLSAMGGFRIAADNALTTGDGGSIDLSYSVPSAQAGSANGIRSLGWDLEGYALGTGARLNIQSGSIEVSALPIAGKLAEDRASGDLLISPGFFTNGGFSSYALTGTTAMRIAPGTLLQPAAQALEVKVASLERSTASETPGGATHPAQAGAAGVNLSITDSSSTLQANLNLREKAAGERPPTDLSFKLNAVSLPRLDRLVLGSGSVIRTDPGATVAFAAGGKGLPWNGGMDLLGDVYAPGGTITATVSAPQLNKGALPPVFDAADPDAETQSGLLHVAGKLSTAGAFVPATAASSAGAVREDDGSISYRQRTQGAVTDGGHIELAANNARVVTDAASLLDVSAAAGTIDVPTDDTKRLYQPQSIWGDAGSIAISTTEASRLEGQLRATRAGLGTGGDLSASFIRHTAGDADTDRADFDHRIVITQGAPDTTARHADSGANAAPFVTSRIAAERINAGGFGSVTLKSDHSIEFTGNVAARSTNALTLDAPIIDLRDAPNGGGAGTAVSLDSGRVALINTTGNPSAADGNSTTPVAPIATQAGSGKLTVKADVIDLMGSVTVNGVRDGAANAGAANSSVVLDSAGDIRLTGLPVLLGRTDNANQFVDALVGGLASPGNIELKAQQIYPTSLSEFSVASATVEADPAHPEALQTSASGTVRISSSPGQPGEVFSAGGKLAVDAATIVQAGTLKAPLGQIELNGRNVSLEPGSLTSVSLAGQTLLLGETLSGKDWYYDLSSVGVPGSYDLNRSLILKAPGDKRVVLGGDTVAIKPGATIDLSGGGEVSAFEFVPGPGGSRDVLQTAQNDPTWAILPGMRLARAPIDTHMAWRSGSSVIAAANSSNTIFISGVAGLEDGYYPLVDAHYALLPGAFQVQAVADAKYRDLPTGTLTRLADGSTVISAYQGVAGSNAHEARTSAYVVRPGSAASQYSEITVTGSGFFASQAVANDHATPAMPGDAGMLAVLPRQSLQFDGTILAEAAAGGLAAQVDIAADKIAVLGDAHSAVPQDLSGFVTLSARSLDGLDGSLLIGGTRNSSGALETGASQVVVANDASTPLQAAEVILAAKDRIEVCAGSLVDGTLPGASVRDTLDIAGDGALLRASSGDALAIKRSGVDNQRGILDVQSGATIAGRSLSLDATDKVILSGTLRQPAGGSLSLASNTVAMGDVASCASDGLVLDETRLASLGALRDLAIRGYSHIDLVGKLAVGGSALQSLVLDAPVIAGFHARDAQGNAQADANNAVLTASRVTLRNSSTRTPGATAADGRGSLAVDADHIVIAEGDKLLQGFSQFDLTAHSALEGSGEGKTAVAGDLAVTAPWIVAGSGARQTVSAATDDASRYFRLDLRRPAEPASGSVPAGLASAGGQWLLEGKSVAVNTAILAPAGALQLAARGADASDGVTLEAGAELRAAGYARAFTDAAAYASAGSVTLSADAGDVDVKSGALIDLSAAAGGGDAGKLTIRAPNGAVTVAGSVLGSAPAGAAGRADIDAARLANLPTLNLALNDGGMVAERILRQRQGDLAIATDDRIRAHHVSIAADLGDVVLDGTIDASAAKGGGRVELFAGRNLSLNAGSLIDVHGTSAGTQASDPYADGGSVEVVAGPEGQLSFAPGATIDIRSGAKGDAGRVTFAAARDADGAALPLALQGTILGQHSADGAGPEVIVRGDRAYHADAITAAMTDDYSSANPVWWEYSNFMNRDAAVKDSLNINQSGGLTIDGAGAEAVSVRAGIEIRSPDNAPTTDLTQSSAWNLTELYDYYNPDTSLVPQWNLHGVGGQLTLRATGSLTIANSLGLPDDFQLPGTESWSIRLVGGADMTAANPLAVAPLSKLEASGGDVVLADHGFGEDSGNGLGPQPLVGRVRSGSGNIEIAAGRDLVLQGNAAVYTAGISQESEDFANRYTAAGGDVRIEAQRDAVGIQPAGTNGQFINDWYRRTTLPSSISVLTQATGGWWAYRPEFHQGVATFGGGDISLSAGRDVTELSAFSASSGRANFENSYGLDDSLHYVLDDAGNRSLAVRGGGDLRISAGADISGGAYLVSLGEGSLKAGGSIGSGQATELYLMGLGSDPARSGASVRAEALGDVSIQNISNPTILTATSASAKTAPFLSNTGYGDARTGFFSYADTTSAELVSVAGDVSLGNTLVARQDGPHGGIPASGSLISTEWSSVAPPRLSLAAMAGSVSQFDQSSLFQPIDLYPSSGGGFTVLAANDVEDLNLRALNVSPDTLPSWRHPGTDILSGVHFDLSGSGVAAAFSATRPRTVTSVADTKRFVVEAEQGDLRSSNLLTSAQSVIRAGRDIVSSAIDVQNLAAADESRIVAGRDIVQDPQRQLDPNTALRVAVAGPGTAVVQAGRNIDLGSSLGIIADGNTRNASLDTTASARLIVIAGVQGKVETAAIDALMASAKLFGLLGDGNSAAMARELSGAIASARSGPDNTTALDQLEAGLRALAATGHTQDVRKAASVAGDTFAAVRLAVARGQPPAALQVLLDGLGSFVSVDTRDGAAVTDTTAAAVKDMVAVLFAANHVGPGDVAMYNSKIQTTGGSAIDLVAPGYDAAGRAAGNVSVGLPAGSKGNNGILTQAGGGISGYVSGDFDVNQSKVLTAQTGDILLYSADGSIDAGRGALTSRSSTPPRRVPLYNQDNVLVGYAYLPPIDVTGSGIRTVSSDPDGAGPLKAPPAGSIFLFAPKGTINAGEAGISSAGDVTIRAFQVLNANAISAGGQSSGVPQVETSSIGALGAGPTPGSGNAAGDATKNIQPAPSDTAKDSLRPTILIVEVLGFGDCGNGDATCQ